MAKQGIGGAGRDALEGMGVPEGKVPHSGDAQLILVLKR